MELSVAELDNAYYFILQECLRHAREIGDDERFLRLLTQLEAHHSDITPDMLNDRQSFIHYQKVLHSLGRLKYADAGIGLKHGTRPRQPRFGPFVVLVFAWSAT